MKFLHAFFVLSMLLTIPVLAVHTSVVSVGPSLTTLSKEVSFSVNATNLGKDKISEVRTRMPLQFSSLKCGTAPNGWILAYSDAIECNYKTVLTYIDSNKSLLFVVSATTGAKDGNYTWEVRSRDVFDGFSLNYPVTAVDATAPAIKASTLKSPNGGEKWEVGRQYDILWNAGDITDNNLAGNPVTLSYATDGKTWNIITENQENDGVYTWTVPAAISDSVRVRLTAKDKAGNAASDEGDAPFSIVQPVPSITIKAGETKSIDVNKDGKNDAKITVRSVTADAAELLIVAIEAPTPAATVAPNVSTNVTVPPKPVNITITPEKGVTSPAVTAVIVILVLIILYLIWRLQQLEKKKK